MDPLIRDKRETVGLIPYRKRGGSFEFYLQKRDAGAPTNPGLFGIFGGGLDGESPEVALAREIREELDWAPHAPRYFSRYETAVRILHVFIEEVEDLFENSVNVREGEYGAFLFAEQIADNPSVAQHAKMIISELAPFLQK